MRTRATLVAARSGAVALAVTSSLALGALPAGAEDAVAIYPCDLSKTVRQLQNYGGDLSKNIMVYNTDAHKSSHFEKIVREGKVQKGGCKEGGFQKDTFRWVVFSGKGEFIRKGDGGYRNWSFAGRWDRVDDKKVVFRAR